MTLALAVAACGTSEEAVGIGPANGGIPSPDGGAPDNGRGLLPVGLPDATATMTTPITNPSSPGPATCARAELAIKRSIPTIWLLIDGSGSMGGDLLGFGGPARWDLLRQALLDATNGLVPRLQASVSFGLMIYDGGLSPPGIHIPELCPRLVVVEPSLNNYAALNTAYPASPLGASTPTHYALEELSTRIMARGPNPLGPTYVVLATDGKPNLCDFHDGVPASVATEQEAVATVKSLADRGTKSFAISMAGGDRALRAHLEEVAQAGATGQPAFDPESKDALAEVFEKIVGGTATCDAQIQGTIVKGRECAGDVRLNDQPLACNDPNGFRLKPDGKTLELVGEACGKLQRDANPTLKATFACEDVVLN